MGGTRARAGLLLVAAAGSIALAAAVARATAAAPPLRNGGTLTIGLAEDPDALDPTLARTFVGRIVFTHMCEKLYDLNAKLEIVPQLAASLPTISADKLTYTIKLRPGIKFNDGTPFNAQAVKTSIDRHRSLPRSTRASELSPVDSVTATGPLTVAIHLKTQYSPLTAQLADRSGMIMSPQALSTLGDKFATNPVCVGPYQFKDRAAGDHITLTKSSNYYNAKAAHFGTIVFRIITDPQARAAALRSGDIQVADRLAATDLASIRSDKNLGLIPSTTIGYQGLTLNIGNGHGLTQPFSALSTPLAQHQNLRTAFDLALDRTTINKVVFNGTNLPDCYPISPVSPWRVTTKGLQCSLKGDAATAAKLVKASGVQTPIPVKLMIATDPVAARLGQVIQSMEEKVGFNVQLQPTEFVTSLNKADAGTFDTFAVGWSGRIDPDGNIYQFVATKGSQNDSGYSDPTLDLVLSNARKATTQQARITLYSKAMTILHRQRPLIYLYHPVQYTGVSKKVAGVQVFGDGLIRAAAAGFTA